MISFFLFRSFSFNWYNFIYLFILSILQEYSVQITFRQQWCDDRLSYAGRLNHGDMRGNYKLIIQLHTKLPTRFHEVFFETVVNSFFSKIYWGDLTFYTMQCLQYSATMTYINVPLGIHFFVWKYILAWPHFCRTQLHSPPNGDFRPRIWAS